MTPAGDRPIRVFLLDDHEIVRRGIADLLGGQDDIVVVGEAATADEAIKRIPATTLMSPSWTPGCPTEAASRCAAPCAPTNPEIRCLILTSYDDDEAMFAAVLAGAAGYVLKQIRGSNLVDAGPQVAAGQSLLDPASPSGCSSGCASGSTADRAWPR